MASEMTRRLSYVPKIRHVINPSRWVYPGSITCRVEGVENFSMTMSRTRSCSSDFLAFCTIKYFGSLSSREVILPGSRVKVAENSSF